MKKLTSAIRYIAIALAVIGIVFFLSETGDLFRSLSFFAWVGLIITVCSFAYCIYCAEELRQLRAKIREEERTHYIFKFGHDSGLFDLIDDFRTEYGLSEDYFQRVIVNDGIYNEMKAYRDRHERPVSQDADQTV